MLLRLDPPLPAKLTVGEQIDVRIAYELKSADQGFVALSPWFGDKQSQCGNAGLISFRRGTGEAVNTIYGPGPLDRIRFLFGDQYVNVEKFQFELVTNGKAEWTPEKN